MSSLVPESLTARLFLGVALAASVVALVGCGPGPQADPDDSVSPRASAAATARPTPAPTPVYKPATSVRKAQNVPVPVLPEAAKANTEEGLEAFAMYWFQTLSYAYETGDLTDVQRMSAPDCGLCTNLETVLTTAWADNKWIVGGRIETPVAEGKLEVGKSSQVKVQTIQQLIEVRRADGSLFQDPTNASNRAMLVVAAFGANGWTLIDFGLIS